MQTLSNWHETHYIAGGVLSHVSNRQRPMLASFKLSSIKDSGCVQNVWLSAHTLLRREARVHIKLYMIVQTQLLDTWAAV